MLYNPFQNPILIPRGTAFLVETGEQVDLPPIVKGRPYFTNRKMIKAIKYFQKMKKKKERRLAKNTKKEKAWASKVSVQSRADTGRLVDGSGD